MKRRPGPLAGRAEAARRAKAITIWNEVLLGDRERSDSLAAARRDPRQLAFDFQQSGGMFREQMPRQRERRHSGPTKLAGAPPAPWQDGGASSAANLILESTPNEQH